MAIMSSNWFQSTLLLQVWLGRKLSTECRIGANSQARRCRICARAFLRPIGNSENTRRRRDWFDVTIACAGSVIIGASLKLTYLSDNVSYVITYLAHIVCTYLAHKILSHCQLSSTIFLPTVWNIKGSWPTFAPFLFTHLFCSVELLSVFHIVLQLL